MTAILGYSNLIDSATLSGGSWETDYPITNLQNRRLFKKAKSTSGGATISIALSGATAIGVVALCAHNLSGAATVRVQGGAFDSGAVTVYAGHDYAVDTLGTSSASWTITIAGNGSAVEIGRVFIGPGFKPATCVDWGYSEGLESSSTVIEALAGPEYSDIRSVRRTWTGQFSWLTDAEAAEIHTAMRLSDISSEVFWMPRSDMTTGQGDAWFLGRFRQLNAISYPYRDQHSVAVEISELL